MNIQILALDGVFDIGLSAILDTLGTANELAETLVPPVPAISFGMVGVRQKVHTAQGLSVPVQAIAKQDRADAIVIPALGVKLPDKIAHALTRRDVLDACAVLRAASNDGAMIAAACTGSFVLAESGLLAGHAATTSWWLAPFFRQRYPAVALEESRMLVSSAAFVTAGAALAHIDLALWLVRQHSPALAAMTARYLLVEPRASQATFVIPDHLAHSDPVVERFEQWARASLAQGFSLSEAAQSLGVSERTLARRMQHTLGKSPLAYFQDLRVAHAVHLLQTSRDDIESIAAQVGYADGVTLRTLLRRKLGKGLRDIRAQISD